MKSLRQVIGRQPYRNPKIIKKKVVSEQAALRPTIETGWMRKEASKSRLKYKKRCSIVFPGKGKDAAALILFQTDLRLGSCRADRTRLNRRLLRSLL